MRTASPRKPVRRGITLVELLVVITIMLLLAVVAIPTMRPMLASRQIRETARAVHSYIAAAQIRAIEAGRPAGVMFVRDPSLPFAATSVQQVEVPPLYGGNTLGSAVQVQEWIGHWSGDFVVLKVRITPGQLSPGLVRRGDLIQFNGQGPWYTIVDDPRDNNPVNAASPPATPGWDFPLGSDGFIDFSVAVDANGDGWVDNGYLTATLSSAQLSSPPWIKKTPPSPLTDPLDWSGPFRAVPFQIRRAPVKSAVSPLELANGMIVDLSCSGTEQDNPPFIPPAFAPVDANANLTDGVQDDSPVLILFSPTGALDCFYVQYRQQFAVDPLYLMIGRRERVWQEGPTAAPDDDLTPAPEDRLQNWQVMGNLWLAINSKTGTMTTAEVYADASNPAHYDAATGTLRPDTVAVSRQYARQLQVSKGGR